MVPDVVFPSGAMVRGKRLHMYYGAADTTCCGASIRLSALTGIMLSKAPILKLKRAFENPVLTPVKDHDWESKAVFNPAAVYLDGKVHILYRAMSEDNTSTFGYAMSSDGVHIDYRAPDPVYTPREPFEQKLTPGGNSGCEDPRLTIIGDRIYLFYTAYDGRNPPRVATTSISTQDFINVAGNGRNRSSSPRLSTITRTLRLPRRNQRQHICVHRLGNDIDYDYCTNLDRRVPAISALTNITWIAPRKGWWDGVKVGAAAPPVKNGRRLDNALSRRFRRQCLPGRSGASRPERPGKSALPDLLPDFRTGNTLRKRRAGANVVFPCGNVIIAILSTSTTRRR